MIQKTVQDAIAYRRSVRVYDANQSIDTAVVKECIRQATLAPTSSNLQLWEFYHVTQQETKNALVKACLNQKCSTDGSRNCGGGCQKRQVEKSCKS